MVPSARKAVTGDGICIGLTYKTCPFIHPKTTRNRDLIEAIVAEVRSHEELKNIAFTSIQINHNTISASHTDNNLTNTPPIAIGFGSALADAFVLTVQSNRCTHVTMRWSSMEENIPMGFSTVTDGHWCCSFIRRGNTFPPRCNGNLSGSGYHVRPVVRLQLQYPP